MSTRTQEKDREASAAWSRHHSELLAIIRDEFPPGRRVKWKTYARGGKGVHWHHGRVVETAMFGTGVSVRNSKTNTVQDKEAKELEMDEPELMPPAPLVPEIDAGNYALGELHSSLITGRLALPVWIRCGRSRHKVTLENQHDFCRGLLLALEMKGEET